ncbi:YfiT family bacillithiol transferase [Chryseobacterium sp. T1]
MEKDIEELKYPIGKFQNPENIDKNQIENWIKIIEEFPQKISNETEKLTEKELNKTYRPNGWTISQVVNHCADSHMNSIIRFKLALTEETPTIKPYFENLWAELSDSKDFPIESSLKILEGLHKRWSEIMKKLNDNDLEREFIHPETQERITLKRNIGIYAWHCEHHLAHIRNAKQN